MMTEPRGRSPCPGIGRSQMLELPALIGPLPSLEWLISCYLGAKKELRTADSTGPVRPLSLGLQSVLLYLNSISMKS